MILCVISKPGLNQQCDAMKLSLCLSVSTSVSPGCPYMPLYVAVCTGSLALRKACEAGNESWMKYGLSSCCYYACLNNPALERFHNPALLIVEVRDLARICCRSFTGHVLISLGGGCCSLEFCHVV